MAEDDNFFSRWSRRKVQVRTGQPLPVDPPAAPAPVVVPGTAAVPPPDQSRTRAPAPVQQERQTAAPAVADEPPPTMEDVARLTPEADFKPFMARQVPAEVRNAAVKKLFADPHFNIMDGLDIYIDDYSKPSPLSAADMARMVGAQFLKLVDDPNEVKPATVAGAPAGPVPAEATTADTDEASADTPAPAADGPPSDQTPEAANVAATDQPECQDDHADLQLQPDHAPERESPGRGAG
ncbi:MAG: DUF3306 domain-containing protein [Hydrogenophaga sp.]|nr:DUF3306 domain-containing protein [Hydrogenophaga sp.]